MLYENAAEQDVVNWDSCSIVLAQNMLNAPDPRIPDPVRETIVFLVDPCRDLYSRHAGNKPYNKGDPNPPATDKAGVKSPSPQEAAANVRLSGNAIVTIAQGSEMPSSPTDVSDLLLCKKVFISQAQLTPHPIDEPASVANENIVSNGPPLVASPSKSMPPPRQATHQPTYMTKGMPLPNAIAKTVLKRS